MSSVQQQATADITSGLRHATHLMRGHFVWSATLLGHFFVCTAAGYGEHFALSETRHDGAQTLRLVCNTGLVVSPSVQQQATADTPSGLRHATLVRGHSSSMFGFFSVCRAEASVDSSPGLL